MFFSNGTRAYGGQYVIALMAGPTSGSEAEIATTHFLTPAAAAGFFMAGAAVSIPTVAGGATAFIQLAVWDATLNGTTTGATFAQAQAYSIANGVPNVWGLSPELTVVTGNPNVIPPGTPAPLVPGLQSLVVS